MIDVTTFGAKGDGSTDDTAAIQSAIYAAVNSGEMLGFPARQYLIGRFLEIPGPVSLCGARTSGTGASSHLSFMGDGGGAWNRGQNGLIRCTSGNIVIDGLVFEAADDKAGTVLFNFSNATKEISGVSFDYCTLLGGGPGSTNTLLWGYKCDSFSLMRTRFQYAKQHVTFGPATVAGLTIDRCIFSEGIDANSYMLDVNVGGNGFGCSVMNSTFELYYSQLAARLTGNNAIEFGSNRVFDGPASLNMNQPTILISANGPARIHDLCYVNYKPDMAGYILGVHCPLVGAKIESSSIQNGKVFITGPATLEGNMVTGTAFLNSASITDRGNYFRGPGHSYQRYGTAPSTVAGYVAGMDQTMLKIDPGVTLQ